MTSVTPSPSAEHELQRNNVALKGFSRITQEWQCTAEERQALLGGIALETLECDEESTETALSTETFNRISLIFGIYKALQILYPTHERANRRIRLKTNEPPFDGLSVMAFMTQGEMEHLVQARRYFDAKLVHA